MQDTFTHKRVLWVHGANLIFVKTNQHLMGIVVNNMMVNFISHALFVVHNLDLVDQVVQINSSHSISLQEVKP